MDDVTLVTTVCERLAAAGVGAWRPVGPPYGAGEVAIHYGALPASPDRAIGVTLYVADDELRTSLAVRRVQLRVRGARGDAAGADRLASATFDALQGLARTAGLSLVTRVLVAHLGADENARQERADSYQIVLDNAEASA